eukprot:862829-Prymnesium_polylepis.1
MRSTVSLERVPLSRSGREASAPADCPHVPRERCCVSSNVLAGRSLAPPPPDGRAFGRSHQQYKGACPLADLGRDLLAARGPRPADCPLARGEMLFPNVSSSVKK